MKKGAKCKIGTKSVKLSENGTKFVKIYKNRTKMRNNVKVDQKQQNYIRNKLEIWKTAEKEGKFTK